MLREWFVKRVAVDVWSAVSAVSVHSGDAAAPLVRSVNAAALPSHRRATVFDENVLTTARITARHPPIGLPQVIDLPGAEELE